MIFFLFLFLFFWIFFPQINRVDFRNYLALFGFVDYKPGSIYFIYLSFDLILILI